VRLVDVAAGPAWGPNHLVRLMLQLSDPGGLTVKQGGHSSQE
jgi:hypothetical protein